jgi:hypothetical protein
MTEFFSEIAGLAVVVDGEFKSRTLRPVSRCILNKRVTVK